MPRHRSMAKESDGSQLAEKATEPETFADTVTTFRGVVVRARLRCWALWSGSSVIHVQGTIA